MTFVTAIFLFMQVALNELSCNSEHIGMKPKDMKLSEDSIFNIKKNKCVMVYVFIYFMFNI